MADGHDEDNWIKTARSPVPVLELKSEGSGGYNIQGTIIALNVVNWVEKEKKDFFPVLYMFLFSV